MAKTVSTYLTTKEEKALEIYCKKHGLSKYAVFKTALTNLLTEG